MKKINYHIIGASSPIAVFLIEKLKKNNEVFLYSSKKNAESYEDFCKKKLKNSIVIYFCNIKDNLKANITLLNKIIDHCKSYKCKFIYISSVNAGFPKKSYYSKIKFECERYVKKNNYLIIRLGLVSSPKPFGPYKSILELKNYNIQFYFKKNTYLIFTKIDTFLNTNFNKLNMNTNLYDYSLNINNVLKSNKKIFFKFNLSPLVYCLSFLNNYFPIKYFFGRLLTASAINTKKIN
jgi:hypothetical protein